MVTDVEIIRLAQQNMRERGGHAISREDVRRAQNVVGAVLEVKR